MGLPSASQTWQWKIMELINICDLCVKILLNAGFSSATFDYQRAMADDRVSVGLG